MIAPTMAPAEALTEKRRKTQVISPTARAVPEPPHPHSILGPISGWGSVLLCVSAFNWNPVVLHLLCLNGIVWCSFWEQEAHKTFQEVESTDLNLMFLSEPRFEASLAKHKATPFVAFHTFLIYIGIYGCWTKNRGGTPKSSILIGFSIISTIHFGVPLFLEIPIYIYVYIYRCLNPFEWFVISQAARWRWPVNVTDIFQNRLILVHPGSLWLGAEWRISPLPGWWEGVDLIVLCFFFLRWPWQICFWSNEIRVWRCCTSLRLQKFSWGLEEFNSFSHCQESWLWLRSGAMLGNSGLDVVRIASHKGGRISVVKWQRFRLP